MRTHLATLVEDFRAHPAEIAVVAHRGVRRYASNYGDLARLAGRFAAELVRRNIRSGDRVVLWGANSAEWIGVFFGCLLRGVIAVPLDAAGSPEFARRILAEVSPSLVAGDQTLLATLPPETQQLAFATISENLPHQPDFSVAPSVQEDSPFQIVFTSGTTSEPKGIVHTHRNVLASLRPIESEIAKYRRYERWVHPLRFLQTLPLSHVFGQFMGLWIPAILAAQLHFIDSFEPARAVELIRRERVSVIIAVPRVLGLLHGHLLRRFSILEAALELPGPLPAWKRWWRFRSVHLALGLKFWAVISGGAALPPELERFWNRLGFALIQGYGMTETAALITLNHPFHIGQGTIGKALPGREVRLSETGEIQVRGDMVSTATWQHGGIQPRQGEWLATGDLAEQSPSGDFRFLGRASDAIVTASGLNIHPADVEAAMLRQPGVRACAVVPCPFAGNVEPVCVIIFSGEDAALQQVVRAANSTLADYQQIRRTFRWPDVDFPYTSTGKLLRRTIRDRTCPALQQGSGTPSDSDPLLSLIAEITGSPVAASSASNDLRLSEDLFLDSLGRVQLASTIEQRMGIELGEDQVAAMVTLGDLRSALRTTPAEPASESPALTQLPPQSRPEPYLYPRWPWSRPIHLLRGLFLEAIVRPIISLLLSPRVRDREITLPPGPFLIVANHVTLLDGPIILYALPAPLRRHIAAAMSGEMLLDLRASRNQDSLLQNLLAPIGYWLITALFNVFPLPRLRGFKQSFAHAGEALDRGYSVLIFPEGRRSRTGQIEAFRPGIGLLASQSRVPVLPVALLGLEAVRPSPANWFRTGRIEVRIGDPITLPDGTSPADWTSRLESAIRELSA